MVEWVILENIPTIPRTASIFYPPPALGFLKCIIALCPQNSMIVNLLAIWIFAFSKAFSRNTLSVCPLWKFQVYPPPTMPSEFQL